MSGVTSAQFREALGRYATGVTVITTRDAEGRPVGMTVNSFASVSLDPPLVLWCVDKGARQFEIFSRAKCFAVHVLQHGQEQIARRFSSESDDLFAGMSFRSGTSGLPLLDDIAVSLQCEVVNRYDEGDHVILIGRVTDIASSDVDPLLFFAGEYRRLQH